MRGALVFRLGAETKPKQGLFEGWVEEVDSGKELRFHSTAELMWFHHGTRKRTKGRAATLVKNENLERRGAVAERTGQAISASH